MAEIRRGFGGETLTSERLPWLEPVEDEDDLYPEPSGGGRLAVWLVIALVVLALAIGGLVYWGRYRAAHADVGEVIHAQPGPYKEKPANPGGLKVDESGVIAEKMGTGTDIDSPLDLAQIPEQPIAGPGSDQNAAPQAQPAPMRPGASAPVPAPATAAQIPARPPVPAHPAATVPPPVAASAPVVKAPKPAARPAPLVPPPAAAPAAALSGGGTIQLGALGSEAKARAVWKSLSSRFGFLAPLAMSITPVKVGDATLYRLRASGGDAHRMCAQLRVAGESCNVVD